LTPIKENMMRLPRSNAQPREGDWFCLNCHNLNFSFRKKCNRCKTQTRQQNESAALIINYYAKHYYAMPSPLPLSQANTSPGTHTPAPARTPEKIHKDLPSVSPLVKKYKAREMSTPREAVPDEGVWGVRDFSDILAWSGRSEESEGRGEESSDELERMISSIML
jgi:hypothetical protein